MARKAHYAAVAGLVVAITCGVAAAGLAIDANGISDWQGVETFDTVSSMGVTYYKADIEYCVYEPGMFAESYSGVVVDETYYVYAYQIVAVMDGSYGSGYISHFSLGIGDDTSKDAGVITYVSGTGDIAPNVSAFAPLDRPYNTARWEYDPAVYSGAMGEVMYFSSPHGPQWDDASTIGSYGFAASSMMPSPIPEPVTLVLLGVGGTLLVKTRRR